MFDVVAGAISTQKGARADLRFSAFRHRVPRLRCLWLVPFRLASLRLVHASVEVGELGYYSCVPRACLYNDALNADDGIKPIVGYAPVYVGRVAGYAQCDCANVNAVPMVFWYAVLPFGQICEASVFSLEVEGIIRCAILPFNIRGQTGKRGSVHRAIVAGVLHDIGSLYPANARNGRP